ncbi:MAG: ribosome recycling factor [Phycisphaerales bacterium]
MSFTDPDSILLFAEEHMEKAVEYLKQEFRGIRTGRAHPALVEFVKVDYYGSMTELKSLAAISVPEPSQLLVKPFDAGSVAAIKTAIEGAGLGLNPMPEGKQLRITIPMLSSERRQKLVAQCKKLAEEQKVAIRNIRRDANKHADALAKAPTGGLPEDEIDTLKEEIQSLTKKAEENVDTLTNNKMKEVQEV